MSFTISLNGNESTLYANFFPPIELTDNSNNNNVEYECALIYFKTFHSIPNVDSSNNLFHYGDDKVITIPEGSYELDSIIDYIHKELYNATAVIQPQPKPSKPKLSDEDGFIDIPVPLDGAATPPPSEYIDIEPNVNTMRCVFYSPAFDIHFEKENSIGSIFGFSKKVLPKNQEHTSDQPINILITNSIRVECNIIEGSFVNDKPSQVLHEFTPSVPPGYQILECPPHLVYLPLRVKTHIQNLQVRIVNEQGNLVNFRKEHISLRIHIRKR